MVLAAQAISNTALDEFVVMPNHFHGIIKILETGRDLSLQPTRRSSQPKTALRTGRRLQNHNLEQFIN